MNINNGQYLSGDNTVGLESSEKGNVMDYRSYSND
jgi:hypothetical protein